MLKFKSSLILRTSLQLKSITAKQPWATTTAFAFQVWKCMLPCFPTLHHAAVTYPVLMFFDCCSLLLLLWSLPIDCRYLNFLILHMYIVFRITSSPCCHWSSSSSSIIIAVVVCQCCHCLHYCCHCYCGHHCCHSSIDGFWQWKVLLKNEIIVKKHQSRAELTSKSLSITLN